LAEVRVTHVGIPFAVLTLGCTTGKASGLFTKPTRPTQPPNLIGMGNEYQAKCGDALRLGVIGSYVSFYLWINVWVQVKLCDPSLTHATPERL